MIKLNNSTLLADALSGDIRAKIEYAQGTSNLYYSTLFLKEAYADGSVVAGITLAIAMLVGGYVETNDPRVNSFNCDKMRLTDFKSSFLLLRRLSFLGNGFAVKMLSKCVSLGIGVERDLTMARKLADSVDSQLNTNQISFIDDMFEYVLTGKCNVKNPEKYFTYAWYEL